MKKGKRMNARKQWTAAQDKFLTSLVSSNDVNWPEIASQVNNEFSNLDRTGKMCRERWYNYLNPDIKQNKITPAEEVQIFDLYKQYGNKWVEIAKNLPGRTENWVKNLYYATLRRYVRNINKFKTVQKEMEWLEGIEVNEKMLAELFLIEHIDFRKFQCIDSPEFKILSKKVGKSRRRKDGQLVDYLLGRRNCEGKRRAKAAAKDYEVTAENLDTLNNIKRVLEVLKSTNTIKLAPVRILKEEGKEGQVV